MDKGAKREMKIEGMRAMVRPMLLWILGMGAFFFLVEGITGDLVDWWVRIWFAGCAEWILERPALKVLKK